MAGQGNPHCRVVMLYMGEGSKMNNATCSALGGFSVTSSSTHKQSGPFWFLFQGGWFCVHSRTLWVSPTNSCEAMSFSCCLSLHRFFSVRGFEALFPCAGTLGCLVCLAPQLFLPVYPCTNVGLPTLSASALPGPPATALLTQFSNHLVATGPLHPECPSLHLLPA